MVEPSGTMDSGLVTLQNTKKNPLQEPRAPYQENRRKRMDQTT